MSTFKFYIGQSLATLNLSVKDFDLTGASGLVIMFCKPNGQEGEVVPTLSSGVLTKNIADQITEEDSGEWTFQARFEKDGNTYYTQTKSQIIEVLEPLNN